MNREQRLSNAEELVQPKKRGRDITLRFVYIDGGEEVEVADMGVTDWGEMPSGDRIRIAAPANDGFWSRNAKRTPGGQ